MVDTLTVLTRAKSLPLLKTASAFRVLIDIAPQLNASEFRELKQSTIASATRLHRNRVRFGLRQLISAGVIECRPRAPGSPSAYRFGRTVVA